MAIKKGFDSMSLKSEVKRLAVRVNNMADAVEKMQANDMSDARYQDSGEVKAADNLPQDPFAGLLERVEGSELTSSAAVNLAHAAQATANEALSKQDQNQNLTVAAFLLRVAQEGGLYNEVSVAAQNKLIQVIERL